MNCFPLNFTQIGYHVLDYLPEKLVGWNMVTEPPMSRLDQTDYFHFLLATLCIVHISSVNNCHEL